MGVRKREARPRCRQSIEVWRSRLTTIRAEGVAPQCIDRDEQDVLIRVVRQCVRRPTREPPVRTQAQDANERNGGNSCN